MTEESTPQGDGQEQDTNRLISIYTFEEFVVGPHNRFPHAAALAVSENLGKAYNPLFLYGPVGIGKTHLMQAVGHRVLLRNPQTRVLYVTAQQFMTEVIELLQAGKLVHLRERYRALDLLLVDDIQFLATSEATQEEFFHMFNDLHAAGKQIIMTSDRPPKMLTTLEDRLRSRFEWGLIADIKFTNLETRMAILKKKESHLKGLSLGDDIRLYIATHLKSNIRELEGFLRRIQAYSQLYNEEISISLVKDILKELIPPEEWTEDPAPGIPSSPAAPPSVSPGGMNPQPAESPAVASPAPITPAVAPTPSVALNPGGTPPLPPPQKAPTPQPPGVPNLNPLYPRLPTSPSKPVTPAPPSMKPPMGAPVSQTFIPNRPPPISPPIPVPSAIAKPPPPPSGPATGQTVSPPLPSNPTQAPMGGVPSLQGFNVGGSSQIPVVFFFPTGHDKELVQMKKKFEDIINKHKLKFSLQSARDADYPPTPDFSPESFIEKCQTAGVNVGVVLGPPSDASIQEGVFFSRLQEAFDHARVSLQMVPWDELSKDYRFLNLALDITLIRIKQRK